MVWLGVAVLGAAASASFVARLHARLRRKSTYRPNLSAWERGRSALMGLTISLIVLGGGLGGALATTWADLPGFSGEAPTVRAWSSDPGSARRETAGTQGGSPADPPLDTAVPAPPEPAPTEATPPATADTPAFAPSGEWAVRVGVFGVEENARAVVTELEEAGIDGFTVARAGTTGRRLHFVYAGRFETRAAAESAAQDTRAAGLDALVVTFTPPSTPPSEGVR